MGKLKKGFVLVVVVLVLAVVAFVAGGFVLKGDFKLFSHKTTITGDILKQEITEISELAVLRCYYSNVGTFEDQVKLKDWKVPLTTKGLIFTYSGEIKLGIEFKDIDIAVNEENKEIVITLPPIKMLSHAIDEKSIKPYDQKKNIFNQFMMEDYKVLMVGEKELAEKKMITAALKKEAAETAKRQIGTFIGNFAGVKDEYTVVFA